MLNKANFENLVNIKNIRDAVIIGRFSDDGDDNDIVIYGFADPDQDSNRRMLEKNVRDGGIYLVYTEGSERNPELIEPVGPVMMERRNFIMAGNGMHLLNTRTYVNKYKKRSKLNYDVEDVLNIALRKDYMTYDMNGHKVEWSKYKADRFLTPRIQGILYEPYTPLEAEAAFAVIKSEGLSRVSKKIMGMTLNKNGAGLMATRYGVSNSCAPLRLDFSGWEKQDIGAQEFQKELTDLVFECMGPDVVGVASILGLPKVEYIRNRQLD